MKRMCVMAVALCFLAGCEERRVISDDSAVAKFARMMGGKAEGGGETSGAWQVAGGGSPSQAARGPTQPSGRLVHEADFSSYKFSTSFQVDDGKSKQGSSTQPGAQGNPPATPPATGLQPTGALGLPLISPINPGGNP